MYFLDEFAFYSFHEGAVIDFVDQNCSVFGCAHYGCVFDVEGEFFYYSVVLVETGLAQVVRRFVFVSHFPAAVAVANEDDVCGVGEV